LQLIIPVSSNKKSGEGYGTVFIAEGAQESAKGLIATTIVSATTPTIVFA